LEGSFCDESNEDLESNSNEDRGFKYECAHQKKSLPPIVIYCLDLRDWTIKRLMASYNQAKQVVDTMYKFYKHTPCASILLGINWFKF